MLFTIIIFIVVLAVLVLVHELGHFIVAKKSGMIVEEFGFGFPPRLFSFKKDATRYSFNLFPVGGFVKIEGEDGEVSSDQRSFVNKPVWQRALTLIAGAGMNFFLAIVFFSLVAGLGFPEEVTKENQAAASDQKIIVLAAVEGSPANLAGLRAGDQILKFAGEDITSIDQLQTLTRLKSGQETNLLFKRQTEIVAVSIIARLSPPAEQGPLGIALANVATIKYSFFAVIGQGFSRSFQTAWLIISALAELLKNLITQGRLTQELAGPIGVAVFSGQVARLGLAALLNFTALLSVNLAVLNLLPIPALDGGRLLFLLIEKVRGRRGQKIEQLSNMIGFSLLITLMILVSIKDLIKFEIIDRIKIIF